MGRLQQPCRREGNCVFILVGYLPVAADADDFLLLENCLRSETQGSAIYQHHYYSYQPQMRSDNIFNRVCLCVCPVFTLFSSLGLELTTLSLHSADISSEYI